MIPKPKTSEQLHERIRAGEHVAALVEHPGFADLLEHIELTRKGEMRKLEFSKPTDVAAVYSSAIGEIRALSRFERIAQDVIQRGRDAEQELRARDTEAVNG